MNQYHGFDLSGVGGVLTGVGGVLASLLLSVNVYAGDIQVESAWARETFPGQVTGMANISVTSKLAATLVAVTSTASKAVEIHSMTHENGMMKMREVKEIELPAGETVNLSKRGYHLMLVGLKRALKQGEKIPITLSIKTSDQRTTLVKALAEVRPAIAQFGDE